MARLCRRADHVPISLELELPPSLARAKAAPAERSLHSGGNHTHPFPQSRVSGPLAAWRSSHIKRGVSALPSEKALGSLYLVLSPQISATWWDACPQKLSTAPTATSTKPAMSPSIACLNTRWITAWR